MEFEMLLDFDFVFCDLNALSFFLQFIEWFEKILGAKVKSRREFRSFVAVIVDYFWRMDMEFEMLVDFDFVFCDLNAFSLFVKFIEWFEKILGAKEVEENLEVSLLKSESLLEMDNEFEMLVDFDFVYWILILML